MVGAEVTPEICQGCPVRRDITKKAFDRGSYQPPLVAEVAAVQGVRRDTKTEPPWLPCQDRNLVNIGGCCGSTKEIRVCDSLDCFRIGSQVTHEMCRECPYRK